ncbi:hypothetical protein HDU76_008940 [Blyttiomyces sp. JEL0837]|nr:hypothetical protein HDU76_008940 [Blyttiomyces sp. JEL0837]
MITPFYDPFFEFPTPVIEWVDPATLLPHEYTSPTHLEALIEHLITLPPDSPLPIPVATASTPRIILDGHHRVAASLFYNLTKIPIWTINDAEEETNWEGSLIKVYSRIDGSRMKLKDVVQHAREGFVGYGVKGTRHVALVSSEGKEIELEKVTPRVLWGVWASGGRPCGVKWRDWEGRLRGFFEERMKEREEKEKVDVDVGKKGEEVVTVNGPLVSGGGVEGVVDSGNCSNGTCCDSVSSRRSSSGSNMYITSSLS